MIPAVFVCNCTPSQSPSDQATKRALKKLGDRLPRPQAIALISNQWRTTTVQVRLVTANGVETPAGKAAAAMVAGAIGATVAVPLRVEHLGDGSHWPVAFMFHKDMPPIVEVSLLSLRGALHHYSLGLHLDKLRTRDVLVLGCGGVTCGDTAQPKDMAGFMAWMNKVLQSGRIDDLLDYRERFECTVTPEPQEQSLMPLFTALGAAGPGASVRSEICNAEDAPTRTSVFVFE
ncbi:hypothetical protein E6W36_10040 [Hankyongella ginsenosidimutans]|uniref:Uncharacterized protein n=1 Tax=Hankyongella ginsenosidimutans TaxID=1763828 RepID=A0A4D7C3V6_9SPHN|nr:hypothetical protein [Hankyongella ginsenosidimutans]QCI79751.1 hypothetical protein E6W36_10040 [Hankyongella ginsenosidimutans]TXG83677.1 MAG: hypothetical protein E6R12_06970 [Sphingomonadales bacterium]